MFYYYPHLQTVKRRLMEVQSHPPLQSLVQPNPSAPVLEHAHLIPAPLAWEAASPKVTVNSLNGSFSSVSEIFCILLPDSQPRKCTVFVRREKKISQDVILFCSTTSWHYLLDKSSMEIYIDHWYPLTMSNSLLSNFPVVFLFGEPFYIFNQLLFFKYPTFLQDFLILKLSEC